jgi:hypothetical protein
MSTKPYGAALARDDTAFTGSFPQAPAIPPRDLAELASAIDRLEALIAAAARSESSTSDALERIADIAFVLHERDVEASLCDALDAAVRDLDDVGARAQASVDRMRQAAGLLSELSRRINSIIARSLAVPPSAGGSTAELHPLEPVQAGKEAGEQPAGDEMLDGGLHEPAQAIVALTEPSLPPADQAPAASDSPRADAAAVVIERTENSDVARDDVESDHELGSPRAADRQAEQALADPEADPGDLFEPRSAPVAAPENTSAALPPLPPAPPPSALASAEHRTMPADEMTPASHQVARASPSPASQRPAADAPQHAIGRQAPNDSLSAVRALSEEEMIALFS